MYKKYDILTLFCRRLKPRLLVMKLSLFLMLVSTLQVSAFTFGQKVTLSRKNVKLTAVLKDIQKQSGYNIFYDKSIVPANALVDLQVNDTHVEKVLTGLLEQFHIGYKLVDKNIILMRKEDPSMTIRGNMMPAQEKIVRGNITNRVGEPLVGVTVLEKGTANSTMTDEGGNYILRMEG